VRKKMDLKNIVQNDVFKTIMNSIYNGIIVIDKSGRIAIFNRAAEIITGINEKNALKKHIKSIIPNTGLLDVLKTGEVQVGKKIVINGITCISNRTPIFYNSGLWGAVGVFYDISDLEKISKELETYASLVEKLEETARELQLIIDSSSDGLYITDGNGLTLTINSTWEGITGLKRDQVLGRNVADIVSSGLWSESITFKVLNQPEPKKVTMVQRLHNGRHVISSAKPVFDKSGNVYRVVTTVRDVTQFLNLEQEIEKLRAALERSQEETSRLRLEYLKGEDMIAKSKEMLQIIESVKQVAPYPTTVLITGESGVGKDIVARLLHMYSNCNEGPFIKINCGAIPPSLIESELFGYKAGAFTGASRHGKPGMVEIANGGTLFLDEIGELPYDLQVKLLQVIQDGQVSRLGGTSSREIDVRFIAASNQDLSKMMEQNRFRADLYYRLNVVPIKVPNLREREEDIPYIALHYMEKFSEKYGVSKNISKEAMEILYRYEWPGNVRELKNIVEYLVVMIKDDVILPKHLPEKIRPRQDHKNRIFVSGLIAIKEAVSEVERQVIGIALGECRSVRSAAKTLGVSHSTLLRKMNLKNLV